VFENVYVEGRGWGWERHTVTLRPPSRWHSVGHGNYPESVLDYTLTVLSPQATQFDLRWRSRPVGLARGPRPSARAVERYVATLRKRRGRAIVSEFRRSGRDP